MIFRILRGTTLALPSPFAYNDRCIVMPIKTCKERILYEVRYRSLHHLQCILIPLHISLYSSLLCHLHFYVNLYILLHSHGKRVSKG